MEQRRSVWLGMGLVASSGLVLWLLGTGVIFPSFGWRIAVALYELRRDGEVLTARGRAVVSPGKRLVLRVTTTADGPRLGRTSLVRATITNSGNTPVTLVLPGDGSYDGWRTPLVGWSVLREGGEMESHTPRAGRYRLVYYYRNVPTLTGWDDPPVNPILRQVHGSTPCWLTSNELRVTVGS